MLRAEIVSNRRRPGERLAEPELTRMFGVSRTPLRDVLKRLEIEGLVHLIPQVGAIVAEIDPPDLHEKFDVLTLLEGAAAGKTAALRQTALLADITSIHEAMRMAARNGYVRDYYALNDAFHRRIVQGSNNDTLCGMHEVMMWHIHRARHWVNEYEPLSKDAAKHHDAIVTAIKEGRSADAEAEMRKHLSVVAEAVMERLKDMTYQ